ncbi:MAG: NAD-dependent epimerase/dehydratase family protein, partial [bacterium]|nr:NAD-dependent epimerase/dehydratase family protein [bacterium]
MDKKDKILITGAAGFVGSHLVRELLKTGAQVVCLIHPQEDTYRIDDLQVTKIYADITKKESLSEAVKDVDYIFHLAAVLGSVDSETFFNVNCQGTKNLVELCLEQKINLKRFLFVSSIAVVGPSGKKKIFDETTPYNPVTEYGKSKLKAEQYLVSIKDKLPFTTVRLPLVYGPYSKGGLFVFYKLLNKRLNVSFGGGASNLAFVWDVVNGMILAAESAGTLSETYILGEE